jgi:TolA-binding protein
MAVANETCVCYNCFGEIMQGGILMSAFDQIQATAGVAIQELEAEITSLEEVIEAHKLSIQNFRIQIQSLKRFLSPEEAAAEIKTVRPSRKNGKSQIDENELQ